MLLMLTYIALTSIKKKDSKKVHLARDNSHVITCTALFTPHISKIVVKN